MRQFISFEVDDTQYQMLHLPVSKSIKVLTRLTKMISEPVGKAVSAVQSGGEASFLDQGVDMNLIGQAITTLGDRLDEATVWNTILELLSTVEKANEQGGFTKVAPEVDFIGKPGHLIKVITQAVTINYSDFLGPVQGVLEKVRRSQQPAAQKAPSTGSSGGLSSKK